MSPIKSIILASLASMCLANPILDQASREDSDHRILKDTEIQLELDMDELNNQKDEKIREEINLITEQIVVEDMQNMIDEDMFEDAIDMDVFESHVSSTYDSMVTDMLEESDMNFQIGNDLSKIEDSLTHATTSKQIEGGMLRNMK